MKAGAQGYRQKVLYLLEVAAKVSPQFSGDFASNWNLVVGGGTAAYKPWGEKGQAGVMPVDKANGTTSYRAYQAGDMQAVTTSMARGSAQSAKITSMKDTVHLVNASDLYTPDGVTMEGRGTVTVLRPQNIIPGRVRIESYVRARARERTKP